MKLNKKILCLVLFISNMAYAQNSSSPELGYYSQIEDREIIVATQEHFSGKAVVDYLFPKTQTKTYGGAYVTFEAKARTAWHKHPAGQHMIVTSGLGYTQEWGKKRTTIKAGDVIWCKPGVKHWHGATPNQPMTHLVISGVKDGKSVEWHEKVTDEEYYKN